MKINIFAHTKFFEHFHTRYKRRCSPNASSNDDTHRHSLTIMISSSSRAFCREVDGMPNIPHPTNFIMIFILTLNANRFFYNNFLIKNYIKAVLR